MTRHIIPRCSADDRERIYLRGVVISDDDMTRIEIRWMEEGTQGNVSAFSGFIQEVQGLDVPGSVEKVFKEWIEERVRGKKIVVSELEIYVNGEFQPLSKEEEEQYMIRIASSSRSL